MRLSGLGIHDMDYVCPKWIFAHMTAVRMRDYLTTHAIR
jgi:hypothetical protein